MAFILWSVCAVLFLIIGISCFISKKPVGFFSNIVLGKIRKVKEYNKAVGKLWLFFGVGFEIVGLPLYSIHQNDPIALLSVLGTVFLVLVVLILYSHIQNKYEE